MKSDGFILYAYASIMMPILVAMLMGLLILSASSYRSFKEEERLELEDFIYRLQYKTNSELLALKTRYTSYLTDDYLKSSSKKWNNYINAINKQLEQNNDNTSSTITDVIKQNSSRMERQRR